MASGDHRGSYIRRSMRAPANARGTLVRSVIGALIILLVSAGVIHVSVRVMEAQARRNLLTKATIAASMMGVDYISPVLAASHQSSSGSEALDNVIVQLRTLSAVLQEARFVYIVECADGQVVALADAEDPESADYSPPGQVLYPALPEELDLFASESAGVVGPRTDSWGSWITAYAPLPKGANDSRRAFLACDVPYVDWSRHFFLSWAPLFLSFAFLALYAAMNIVAKGRQQSQHARYLATHDYLTGLSNRAMLLTELSRAIARSKRGKGSFLLVVDIDNFNAINHTLTYAMGDEVLVAVARHINELVRRSDLVARLSGDEFAVLLRGADRTRAEATAERIRSSLEHLRFEINGTPVYLTVSLGIVPVVRDADVRDVALWADTALAAAKEAGKNRLVTASSESVTPDATYDGSGNEKNFAHVAMLEKALCDDELIVYFQSIIPISRQCDHLPACLTGGAWHEALLRLKGPDGSIMSAGALIPMAEGIGLIPQIDMWVLDKVITILKARPDMSIAMNLSARSVARPSFLAQVEQKVAQAGLAPFRLCFELTETVAMGNIKETGAWMRRMKELGVLFAVDDFGAGHSAISYLYELPVDVVKIAGEVVQAMASGEAGKPIVEAINSVCHVLGAWTVAEWVEDEHAVNSLQGIGIDFAQGYFFSRPSPLDDEC